MNKYVCPVCGEVNNAERWYEQTKIHCGEIIGTLPQYARTSYFHCPSCDKDSFGHKLRRVDEILASEDAADLIVYNRDKMKRLIDQDALLTQMYADLCKRGNEPNDVIQVLFNDVWDHPEMIEAYLNA